MVVTQLPVLAISVQSVHVDHDKDDSSAVSLFYLLELQWEPSWHPYRTSWSKTKVSRRYRFLSADFTVQVFNECLKFLKLINTIVLAHPRRTETLDSSKQLLSH